MYTCPMHPEIRREAPGNCPKCGMRLVPADAVREAKAPIGDDRGLGELTLKSYISLLTIISMILAVAAAVSANDYLAGSFSAFKFVSYFMAGFFVAFSGFKLLDLRGFAEGYSTYDLLAQRIFWYGYLYPFIELGFGLLMAAGVQSLPLLWGEAAVMAFSGFGVALKLARREPVKCVCLGTFLKIPLTNITLVEDFGMAALALVLALHA